MKPNQIIKQKQAKPKAAEVEEVEEVESAETEAPADLDAAEATEEAAEEADTTAEGMEKAPPLPKAKVAATAAIHRTHRPNIVRCRVLKEERPCPVVGFYDIGRELKITHLAVGATIPLPRHVAEVLDDTKTVAIID